jgi:hypothetical protein
MNWEIITNSKEVSGGLDIVLTPRNDVIRFAILQFKINDLPKLIEQKSKSRSFGIEFTRIVTFNDMDWEDKAWAKNIKGTDLESDEIFLIHDAIGETIIKEAIFDEILYDYSCKVLDIYKLNNKFPESWTTEMEEAIEELKKKNNLER